MNQVQLKLLGDHRMNPGVSTVSLDKFKDLFFNITVMVKYILGGSSNFQKQICV